jgi:hypothetical protein
MKQDKLIRKLFENTENGSIRTELTIAEWLWNGNKQWATVASIWQLRESLLMAVKFLFEFNN